VFYHIFAGKDIGAYYRVHLKNPVGSSLYQVNPSILVESGYIGVGGFATETKDFTAPSGYREVCVTINAKEECGFKQTSTGFIQDYIRDKYVEEQTTATDVKSERECISGSSSIYSLFTPNLQEGLDEVINPELYNRGIVRSCSTGSPGKGTDAKWNVPGEQRWKEVGHCGDERIKCWLDTKSVEDIVSIDTIKERILEEGVEEKYKAFEESELYLSGGNYDREVDKFEKVPGKTIGEGGGDKVTLPTAISAIENAIDKVFLSNNKAQLFDFKARAWNKLARIFYQDFIDAQPEPQDIDSGEEVPEGSGGGGAGGGGSGGSPDKFNLLNIEIFEDRFENGNYDQFIIDASEKYNVPVNLIKAIIAQESSGFPDGEDIASNAVGLMQVSEIAALDVKQSYGGDFYEKLYDDFLENPKDPYLNIEMGTAYYKRLEQLYRKTNNVEDAKRMALMAYNEGIGRMNGFCANGQLSNCNGIPSDVEEYADDILNYERAFGGKPIVSGGASSNSVDGKETFTNVKIGDSVLANNADIQINIQSASIVREDVLVSGGRLAKNDGLKNVFGLFDRKHETKQCGLLKLNVREKCSDFSIEITKITSDTVDFIVYYEVGENNQERKVEEVIEVIEGSVIRITIIDEKPLDLEVKKINYGKGEIKLDVLTASTSDSRTGYLINPEKLDCRNWVYGEDLIVKNDGQEKVCGEDKNLRVQVNSVTTYSFTLKISYNGNVESIKLIRGEVKEKGNFELGYVRMEKGEENVEIGFGIKLGLDNLVDVGRGEGVYRRKVFVSKDGVDLGVIDILEKLGSGKLYWMEDFPKFLIILRDYDEITEEFIFDISFDKPRDNPWTFDSAISEVSERNGKYFENRKFIDELFIDKILTKVEFDEIRGKGLSDNQENMEFVLKLLVINRADVPEEIPSGGSVSADSSGVTIPEEDENIEEVIGPQHWTLDLAIRAIIDRNMKGDYSDNYDNKIFIDSIYFDEILSEEEYDEINGWFGFGEEDMNYVLNLLNEKKKLEPKVQKIVVIDPGHGGKDPGTFSNPLNIDNPPNNLCGTSIICEEDIVLGVSLKLRIELEELGYRVHLTRTRDREVNFGKSDVNGDGVVNSDDELAARVKFAKDRTADYFISIHADSFVESSASGATFYLDCQEGQEERQEESRKFAEQLRTSFAKSNLKLRSSPVLCGNLHVLRESKIPAVLIELGFISNPEDLINLQDPQFQGDYAAAIADSVNIIVQ